jgi:hypothetical protein
MQVSRGSDLLKQLSPKEFLGVGLNQIAYIRSIPTGGDEAVFSIHAADGTQISVVPNYEEAIMAARTNDLHPVTLH